MISDGDTQWMTAGGGILHDELPSERLYRAGGPVHSVQLWVNLPPALKMTDPRYQSLTSDALRLLTTPDGGALIRLIAGDVAGFEGPGTTHTPSTYAHVTLAPGAQLSVAWNPSFSAFAYVLTGRGTAGAEARPIGSDQLAVFGPGDHLVVTAADTTVDPLDVLLFGGLPIGAPIAHYGPFVMNTEAEIRQAIEDYQAGRLGTIPADHLALELNQGPVPIGEAVDRCTTRRVNDGRRADRGDTECDVRLGVPAGLDRGLWFDPRTFATTPSPRRRSPRSRSL